MVQDQPRLRTLRLQFEFHDGIVSVRPHRNAPSLDEERIVDPLRVRIDVHLLPYRI